MKLGIIGAMDEEVHFLKEQLENKKKKSVATVTFYTGTLHGKEIILLKSGIGKVNAAMATTILLEHFQPTYVINIGSAGGVHKDLEVGHIVIGERVVHHDVDVTAFNYSYGQVPNLPQMFEADPYLLGVIGEVLKEQRIHSQVGIIATGDTFMKDVDKIQAVKRRFNDVLAIEMEGAAIAQVCFQYDIPFVIIRSLSDIAGKDSPITFNEYLQTAAKNATMIIEEVTKRL